MLLGWYSKMSSTMRAIFNKNRVATARQIDSSTFQQFFPAKVTFKNEKEWMEVLHRFYGGDVFFQIEDAPKVPPAPAPSPVVNSSSSSNTTTNTSSTSEPDLNSDNFLNMKNWTFTSKFKHEFPAGKYWIGDICYCLPDKMYDKIFGGQDYESGLYKHKDGGFFFLDNTAYGDGLYMGSDGFEYGVDAGIIGIVSEELVSEKYANGPLEGGKIHEFKHPFTCKFGGGKFRFRSYSKNLTINTEGEDDDDY
jgi:hypothetical protein